MKPAAIATLLIVLLLPGAAAARRRPSANSSVDASSPSRLARKYARKREALLREFSARRRILVRSPQWRTLGPGGQAAALDALVAGWEERDGKLAAEYDALLHRSQRARQARFDEVKTPAPHDGARDEGTLTPLRPDGR